MNTLPHLLVAEDVWRRIGWPQDMRGPMLLGAIAPDAYRLVHGATHRDTHFRSVHQLGQRMEDFTRRFLHPAFEDLDVYAEAFFSGWLTHLCADDVWRRRLAAEVPALWDGVRHAEKEQARELRRIYRANCAVLDYELSQVERPRIEEIKWHLGGTRAELGVGSLRPREIGKWKDVTILKGLARGQQHTTYPTVIEWDMLQRAMLAAQDEATALIMWEIKSTEKSVLDDPENLV